MRNRILLVFFTSVCFFASYAQGDCGTILKTAREFKAKGEYKKAVERYEILNKQCPNYVDEKIRSEWKACQNKLNSNKPSNQHVEVKPNSGSPTSPETTIDLYGRVKVSFDAGKATPSCENVQSIIKQLEDDENLELKIEIPWCRDLYSLQFIEKRIRSITEIIINAGIVETRISSDIKSVDVLDGFDNLMDVCNDKFSEHIILINADEGYNVCDRAWLKTVEKPKFGDGGPSVVLSRTEITFRPLDDSTPQIIDDNANICKTVKILNANTRLLKLIIEGYASDAASEDENMNLAQRRANSVREMFILLGVNPDQIETASYGLTNPQNGQFITNSIKEESRAVVIRIVKREPQNIKILFDYDKDIPKISDYKAVDEHANFLKNQSTYKLIVEGYTCDQGPEEHNRDLAQRRAYIVRELFIEKGVSPDLIETASYTVNDPQNRQNITNQNECDVAICRIVKR